METLTFTLPRVITVDGISRNVESIDMDLSETTAETIVKCLIFHIRSKTSNAFASMKDATQDELNDEAHRHIADVENNEVSLGSGFGKTALTVEVLEMRDAIVIDAKARFNLSAADAKKAAMHPSKYFARVAEAKNDGTTPENVREAFEAHIAPLVAQKKNAGKKVII